MKVILDLNGFRTIIEIPYYLPTIPLPWVSQSQPDILDKIPKTELFGLDIPDIKILNFIDKGKMIDDKHIYEWDEKVINWISKKTSLALYVPPHEVETII